MGVEQHLPDGWRYESIGALEAAGIFQDIQDGNHGEKHPKATDYMPSGIPFVMAKDIEGNRLNLKDCAFISRSLADSLRIGFARPGDVLLTHKATMGRVAIVPEGYDYIVLTPQVTYYRIGDHKQLSNAYLKYAFLGPDFQHQLNSDSDQSTRKYIGITAQRRLRIPLPPLNEQRAIAAVLGTLDEKIELNRQTNETLENIGRALFKSWFLDFEPVRAKVESRQTGLPKTLADLFPDAFEDSEIGEIPRGWHVGRLEDIANVNALTLSRTDPLPFIDYVEISEVMQGNIGKIERYERGNEPSRARRRLRHGDTVLSTVRPDRGAYFLALNPSETLIASTGFAVLTPKNGSWAFVYSLATRRDIGDYLGRLADGGAYPAVRPEVIGDIQVALPPNTEPISRFEQLVRPLYEKSAENRVQSQTLEQVRDALLPKLISGELRAPEAERILGGHG